MSDFSQYAIPKRNVKRRKFRPLRFFTILLIAIVAITAVVYAVQTKMVNFPGGSVSAIAPSPTDSPSVTIMPVATPTPTAKPAATAIPASQNVAKLKKALQQYVDTLQGVYGIYYYNLVDESQFGINSTEEYYAASTSKIAINLYLYKKIETGEIEENTKLTYEAQDYEAGTGTLQFKKKGTKYSLNELAKLSIEQSDNVAANMLQRYLGGRKAVRAFMGELGGIVAYGNENISCPKDMALYMKNVYDFSLKNEVLGGRLVGFLKNTIFNDRIPKLLPNYVQVAHKIGNYWGGEWGTALHDIGIIYADRPYILSVMTKRVNDAQAKDAIAKISKKVYDFVK